MNDSIQSSSDQRVFNKCPRCEYSLRCLPADHACPECGLRFDERCELYRTENSKRVLAMWLAIFVGSGWLVYQRLSVIMNIGAAPAWDKIAAVCAIVWFFCTGCAVWTLATRYRRGFAVAVTTEGLLVRLPGVDENLIAWENIGGAAVIQIPENRPQASTILINDKQMDLQIGGVANVFPTRNDVERFVAQVNARATAAKTDEAQTLRTVDWRDPS